MAEKQIGAARFKAVCLRLIDEMRVDGRPVTITKRGRPVAVLAPAQRDGDRPSVIGALAGTVLRYDDPFAPATDPADWDAAR